MTNKKPVERCLLDEAAPDKKLMNSVIDEMAQAMLLPTLCKGCENLLEGVCFLRGADCYMRENAKTYATALYNAGYCKVTKPVIKEGEVIGFICNEGCEYIPKTLLALAKAQVRKNTAKELLQKVYFMLKYDGHTVSVHKNDILDIAKDYDIELTEQGEI